MVRIECNFISIQDWNGTDLYTYEFRVAEYSTPWGELPALPLWGSPIGEYQSNGHPWQIRDVLPRRLNPPTVYTSPPGTPQLYWIGSKYTGAFYARDLPLIEFIRMSDIHLYMVNIYKFEGYYIAEEPYEYPIIPPDTLPPNGWYRVPPQDPGTPYVPPDAWNNQYSQMIYYRNSQEMICELYPEFLFVWDGAIPGPSHFLYYLQEAGWTGDSTGTFYKLQKLGSAYGGRDEYILNNETWELPAYVEYEWVYLPPYPGHSAGEMETWRIPILVPAPGEYPIDHYEPPIPPPPEEWPGDIFKRRPKKKGKKYKKTPGKLDAPGGDDDITIGARMPGKLTLNGEPLTLNGEDLTYA
jgi:hypothetical protein